MNQVSDNLEWLEADGLGGFASGTVSGIRTRRYHALLLPATTPPTGRMVLVNGFDAWIETTQGRVAVSSQRYVPDVIHPDGSTRIEQFRAEPWPTWTYAVAPGLRVQQEIFVAHDRGVVIIAWRLLDPLHDDELARLIVRPFLSGRDYHSTHHENGICRAAAGIEGDAVTWHPYDGVPAIVSRANAHYTHAPQWYRRFQYTAEQARGLDFVEDLMSPGELTWDLTTGEALWLLQAGSSDDPRAPLVELTSELRRTERARRSAFPSSLHRAADAYLVRRGTGRTVMAGYPWFTDWGRDTFIALRGLCFTTGRFDEGRDILLEWADLMSEGMLPNWFPDGNVEPEFNAVDASLWFVIAVRDLCAAADRGETRLDPEPKTALLRAVSRILDGYTRGTRYGIHADADGLLACGERGAALTWMDARVGERAITPRIGKPVEVQALWLCALAFAAGWESRWQAVHGRGHLAFNRRFWNDQRQCLYDVVDVDHQPGAVDASLRPNQIYAVGGLGTALVDADRARQVVQTVEAHLLTPVGLRSMAPDEPAYVAHYRGGPAERDAAYHQGTTWPYLIGPFVEAWLAVHGHDDGRRQEAADRFVRPLMDHMSDAGIGHVFEVADGEAPFTPGGCPFQAWSLGELLRMRQMLGLDERHAAALGAKGQAAPHSSQR